MCTKYASSIDSGATALLCLPMRDEALKKGE